MNLAIVVGARPNFIKVAPIIRAIKKYGRIQPFLIHTGQHYDYNMSKVFFEELAIPTPNCNLNVGSGTATRQIAETMLALENVIDMELKGKLDAMMVVGDVNATLATALVTDKMGVPLAHVEAGVRSFDDMPEETNRRLTDHLSRWLFTTSKYDDANLKAENICESRVFRVGNVLADALLEVQDEGGGVLDRLGLRPREYVLCTLHRPSNVDHPEKLAAILKQISAVARDIPVVFPVHPRTGANMAEYHLEAQGVTTMQPLGYLSMVQLERNALFVITDSGGIQVETTILGVPCLTLLDRPLWRITHEEGTNILCRVSEIPCYTHLFLNEGPACDFHRIPQMWDGHTAERIVEILGG